MSDPFMDDLFKNDPGTLNRCYPHEYKMRTDRAYKQTFDDLEGENAKSAAAKVTEAEKAKQRQLDEWQAQAEGRGLTPEQWAQVRHYVSENVIDKANQNIKAIAEHTAEIVDHCNESRAAIHKLEARVDALEKLLETKTECLDSTREQVEALRDAHMEYRGIHTPGLSYHRNAVVTCHGSAWISLTDDNRSKPGADTSKWQLMVKKGRDAQEKE